MKYFIVPTLNKDVFLLTTSYYNAFAKSIYRGNYKSVVKVLQSKNMTDTSSGEKKI